MIRRFTVYASKNMKKPSRRSGKLNKPEDLWVRLTDSDQFAVEYATNFIESDGYNIKDLSNIDLESYARKGCYQVDEGNAEPEYAEEDFYMDEADFDAVYNYLKAKRDNEEVIE
jgi:hypothetical protein